MRNPDGWGRRPHKWRGRWRAYLTIGYEPDGRPIRRYVYGRTESECGEKLLAARSEHAQGLSATDRSLTVQAYLSEWIKAKADEVAPRTLEIYQAELRHATGILGRVKLADLKPLHVERMMRAVNGKKVSWGRQSAVLTPRAANRARSVLGAALADAVRLGVLGQNPVDKTRPLRHREADVTVWTASQVTTFLEVTAAGGAAQHALFYLALTTGMRIGELQALEWRDVDQAGVHVRRTAGSDGVKTTAARRLIPLPEDARQVMTAYRAALAVEGAASHLALPTTTGRMVSRQNVRKAIHRWAGVAGVPKLRPHDLRHTFASMMIAAGTNPAELARILGHTSPAFTLRRYVHFFERAEKREARTLRDLTGDRAGVRSGGTTSDRADVADSVN